MPQDSPAAGPEGSRHGKKKKHTHTRCRTTASGDIFLASIQNWRTDDDDVHKNTRRSPRRSATAILHNFYMCPEGATWMDSTASCETWYALRCTCAWRYPLCHEALAATIITEPLSYSLNQHAVSPQNSVGLFYAQSLFVTQNANRTQNPPRQLGIFGMEHTTTTKKAE